MTTFRRVLLVLALLLLATCGYSCALISSQRARLISRLDGIGARYDFGTSPAADAAHDIARMIGVREPAWLAPLTSISIDHRSDVSGLLSEIYMPHDLDELILIDCRLQSPSTLDRFSSLDRLAVIGVDTGSVTLPSLPLPVSSLQLRRMKLTNSEVERLLSGRTLALLDLGDNPLTDSCAATIASCRPELLYLDGTCLSAAGIAQCMSNTRLIGINIDRTKWDEAAWGSESVAPLEWLSARHSSVGNDLVIKLTRNAALERLDVAFSNVSADAVLSACRSVTGTLTIDARQVDNVHSLARANVAEVLVVVRSRESFSETDAMVVTRLQSVAAEYGFEVRAAWDTLRDHGITCE